MTAIKTIVHFCDGSTFGGTEQVLLQILAGLDRQQWRPVLYHHAAPGLAPLLEKAREHEVKVQTVPRIQTVRDIGRLRRFARILRDERPSIFHAHLNWPLSCKYGIAAAMLARVPAVVATAHLYADLDHRFLLHAQPRLIAFAVDRYLAVSRAVADQLCHDFGISASKVQIVPNGVSIARFNKPANAVLRAALAGGTTQPLVLMVGRLEKQKGQCYLIEAAAKIPEARFIFVGEGPDQAALEALAREVGVDKRVVFLGYRQDVPELLACADLFVLPSLYEGMPLSVMEAMAAGTPVIATAIGGNDELITPDETGLLVPPADPKALAQAIRALLSEPDRAARLAVAARKVALDNFAVSRVVRQVVELYDELLSR